MVPAASEMTVKAMVRFYGYSEKRTKDISYIYLLTSVLLIDFKPEFHFRTNYSVRMDVCCIYIQRS